MNVEIWSDVVCPWCYIGKRRFETALAGFAHRDEVEVVWRSFELDPAAPRRHEGTLNGMLARKYLRCPSSPPPRGRPRRAGCAEGALDEGILHGGTGGR